MFSCCLPLYRDQGVKRSSHKSGFRSGPRYFDPQLRPVSPLKWLEPEDLTRVIAGQQPPRFWRWHATWNPRPKRVLRSTLDPVSSPGLQAPRLPRKFPACAYMRPNGHGNHSWPESLEPEEAEPKAPAQEAEEAPAETPEVQTEASDEESDEELEAWAPPELLPPPSASPVAAVEPGPAWEAPADMTEAPPPLDEEPSLEPAQGPASEEELPPESPAAPAPEPQAETARRLPSEKLISWGNTELSLGFLAVSSAFDFGNATSLMTAFSVVDIFDMPQKQGLTRISTSQW
ncbi:proline-rich protein 36-like [Eptesicus fuscus]|uniref:proline-rich protein 36-like n=1 Tax=Eptesicus fuscus TaxID=29078 RepID=UPI002403DFB4|nr:proline-rich protein 36-like [Eptesicus fuscus]